MKTTITIFFRKEQTSFKFGAEHFSRDLKGQESEWRILKVKQSQDDGTEIPQGDYEKANISLLPD